MFLVALLSVGPRLAHDVGEQWHWTRWQHPVGAALGAGMVLAGAAAFLYCTGLFVRLGRGTPVPMAPPSRFVSTGLHRHTRNPIYLAYGAILFGEAVFLGSTGALVYAALMCLVFHIGVVVHEEPQLRRRFGADYARYSASVPRWIPVLKRDRLDA